MPSLIVLILIIFFALVFDYMNGVNDSANAIAVCVSTRALSVGTAVLMAVCLNFLGAMISTKVANTIGTDILHMEMLGQECILYGLIGAILWSIFTWYNGIPSSSTHALIGGLIGAAMASAGVGSLKWSGIKFILVALLASPLIGLLVGFWFMVILMWTVRRFPPSWLNRNFRKAQVVAAAMVAFAHGTADAQKSMGIITMALVSYGCIKAFSVPWYVMLSCAVVISLGTAIGGWRIIRTIGRDFVKLQPANGFCAQASTALVVLGTSAFGFPSSTTHILTSSIFGIGLTKRLSAINWKVARNIICAWTITIPAAMTTSFVVVAIVHTIQQLF